MKDPINWFELPVINLERATAFYETVLARKLKPDTTGPIPMAIFTRDGEGIGGALIKDDRRKPVTDGALVYFNTDGALDACVGRVAKAGGKVLMPKTDIGDPGFIAIVLDTEGNSVGLHSERS
jgi:predicted enzyme related to lactoylglutathione lyase